MIFAYKDLPPALPPCSLYYQTDLATMVKTTQLMWAFLTVTGAVAERFGRLLELRTNSSYIVEVETTVFLGQLPESHEHFATIWTALKDNEKDVVVWAEAVNNGPGCGGSSEQWCIFADANLESSLPEEKRLKRVPGFATTPGPSYKIHCMATGIPACMRLFSADIHNRQVQ